MLFSTNLEHIYKKKRIFNSEEACPHQLRDVSTEILEKCDGLPLAIISISGMLASEGFNREEWEHVRNSLGSGTNLTLEGMRKILDLSYRNFPLRLKTCLLYLGMYPEDFRIERSHLELQRIAEDFVPKENGQDVEKVCRNYFNELVNRSLIQPIAFDNRGLVTACKIHDMMLDLILFKCAEENFLTILDDPRAITKLNYKVRRLSLQLDGPSDGTMLPHKVGMSQIRTVMIFRVSQGMPPLPLFKFLRVLHVYEDAEADLTGLCKLYQLRYLVIRAWRPYKLPAQIRGLRHLETLDVAHSMNIPSDIVHLPCLMFLDLNWHRYPLPDGLGRMKSLRCLKGFDLTMNSLDNIEDLGELTNLRDITVCSVSSLANSSEGQRRKDALNSSLGKICTSLENLALYIRGCYDALMALSPPPRRLERLVMPVGFFSKVPNWMGELSNLKELDIIVLSNDVSILAELPVLTHLKLFIKEILKETVFLYDMAFPVLKSFELWLSSPWYLTFRAGAMPKLQRFSLTYNAKGSEQNGPGPAGVQHLSALEEFSTQIGGGGYATESELTSAESALRSAINMHPSSPHVEIQCKQSMSIVFSSSDDSCPLSDDCDNSDSDEH